jgi:hypothetical protein
MNVLDVLDFPFYPIQVRLIASKQKEQGDSSMRARVISEVSSPTWLKPKAFFLAAAFASFLLSVGLWFAGDREAGVFVGLWVPSICAAGALVLIGGRRD